MLIRGAWALPLSSYEIEQMQIIWIHFEDDNRLVSFVNSSVCTF